MSIIKLPAIGENIDSIQVIKTLVKAGDTIKSDQLIFELETGKASLELPSPSGGKVTEILVKEGDIIAVGQDLIKLEKGSAKQATEPKENEKKEKAEAPTAEPEKEAEPPPPAEDEPEPAKNTGTPHAKISEKKEEKSSSKAERKPQRVPAAPSVRRFARETGVEINDVPGTGANGRVSVDDVKSFIKTRMQSPAAAQASGALPAFPDFAKWGPIQTEKMSNVRYCTAVQIARCSEQIPMVTQFGVADITELEALRKKFAPKADAAGGKLTMATMMVKIIASALKVFPQFNTSIDVLNRKVIYKEYYNIGIAVSVDSGLYVPVLRDVDQKNMIEVAAAVSEIAQKTRDGKLGPEDLQGGCFTLSNLGNIGGTHFTPIVNYPEVAILGMGRAYPQAAFKEGKCVPSIVLPLSLSYDHRMLDGADGARFLKWITDAIEEPLLLSLEG